MTLPSRAERAERLRLVSAQEAQPIRQRLAHDRETEELPVWVLVDGSRVMTGVGSRAGSELTVRGDVRLLLGVVTGAVRLQKAEERGLVIEGSTRARRKIARLVA